MLLNAIAAPLFTSGSASGWSRNSCGSSKVAMASLKRATCCVTSTRATAKSRVALNIQSPSVQTSTTSPVVAFPCSQSLIAQANSAIVSATVTPRVNEPQLLQVAKAAPTRGHFPVHCRVKAIVLVIQPAKRPDQRQVVDYVDHFSVDRCSLVREIVVKRLARGRQAKHRKHHAARHHDQTGRHRQADGSDQDDCR